MKRTEPIEITDARSYLREWESINWIGSDSEAHYRGLDKWNRAFDLLNRKNSLGNDHDELITNLRLSYTRRLFTIMQTIYEIASSSAYFALLFATIKVKNYEKKKVFEKNHKLAESFRHFKELRRDELDRLIRS